MSAHEIHLGRYSAGELAEKGSPITEEVASRTASRLRIHGAQRRNSVRRSDDAHGLPADFFTVWQALGYCPARRCAPHGGYGESTHDLLIRVLT